MAKHKKELLYWGIGAALALALFIYAAANLRFLGRQLNIALNPNLIKPADIVRFNLDKIKDLQIPGLE